MKISELEQIIKDLNDGEEPDYETSIVSATNLALNHLNRIIPSLGTASIEQDEPILTEVGDVDTDESYEGEDVKGISFEARGSGSVLVNDVVVKTWSGYTSYTPVRFIPASTTVKLTFSGIVGAVQNLGFFASVISETLIPIFGEYVEYDMTKLASDYINFTSSPCRSGGDAVPNCIYRGTKLLIPSSERGRITVRYKRKPTAIDLDSVENDDEIDIDPECEDLLSLLVAYHITLEDNRNKALIYLEQFNQMAALAKAQRFKDRNDTVYTLYGW